MNKIILIGRIAKDLQSSKTSNGKTVIKSSIAVDRKFKDKDGNKVSDFFQFTLFGTGAEIFAQYVKKGSRVMISGEMQSYKFQDKNGVERMGFSVMVDDFEFLEPKTEVKQEPTPSYPSRLEVPDNPQMEERSDLDDGLDDDLPFMVN